MILAQVDDWLTGDGRHNERFILFYLGECTDREIDAHMLMARWAIGGRDERGYDGSESERREAIAVLRAGYTGGEGRTWRM